MTIEGALHHPFALFDNTGEVNHGHAPKSQVKFSKYGETFSTKSCFYLSTGTVKEEKQKT